MAQKYVSLVDTGLLSYHANRDHDRVKEMERVNRRWMVQHFKEFPAESCFITNKAIMYTQMDLASGLLDWNECDYLDHLQNRGGRGDDVVDNAMVSSKLRKRKAATPRKSTARTMPYAVCTGMCLRLPTQSTTSTQTPEEVKMLVKEEAFTPQLLGDHSSQLLFDESFSQQLLDASQQLE